MATPGLALALTGLFFLFLMSERWPAERVVVVACLIGLLLGLIPPVAVWDALSNPALLTIAALFVLSGALVETGLITTIADGLAQGAEVRRLITVAGLFLAVAGLSAFINNTPLVVILVPVVQQMASRLGWSQSRLLLPLSFAAILGGTCSLVGTSTNLLVAGMAADLGLRPFSLFEIALPGIAVAVAGLVWLAVAVPYLPNRRPKVQMGTENPLPALKARSATVAAVVFGGVVVTAGVGVAPMLWLAVAGAGLVVAGGCLRPAQVLKSAHPRLLIVIAGMLSIGGGLENSGALTLMVGGLEPLIQGWSAFWVLVAVYVLTSALTEVVSNSAVAVLMTPLAVGLAASLGVDARPFVVAVLFAASASFATPYGYQTNTLVHRLGGYRVMDFLVIGLPLNVIAGVIVLPLIPRLWPF
ncbi:MAG: SLC13 family permease [Rhodospirillales bacterium]